MKTFVKNWLHNVWELLDTQHLERYYTQDMIGYYHNQEVNFDTLKEKIQLLAKKTESVEIEVHHLVIENQKFVLHATQHMILKDQKEIMIPSLFFAHLKDQKIYHYWLKTHHPFDFQNIDTLEEIPHKP